MKGSEQNACSVPVIYYVTTGVLPAKGMRAAIWWIRRDLRLSDNLALMEAVKQAGQVIPVFILDPGLLRSFYLSEKRLAFLYAGLRVLDQGIRRSGNALVIRHGRPIEVLHTLLEETGAGTIYAETDVSPYARRRDERAARELPLHLTPGLTVHPIQAVKKNDGNPYTVFTPYSRMWLNLPLPGQPIPAPDHIPAFSSGPIASLPLEDLPEQARVTTLFPAGEKEAQRRLQAFVESGIYQYNDERNRMDLDSTSKLSPYLRFGMLSARQAAWAARNAKEQTSNAADQRAVDSWLNELIWREFYLTVLYHFPQVRQTAFRPAMRDIPWRNDLVQFAAWTEGLTGYPVVDAAMRQLTETGWMHNRARMITASFLTKDLLIDWRWGERFFMQHLIDGDPAANNGGWQWTAGTGTDAAPYFRIFHPVRQGQKFDPNGSYVRRWLPELARVPDQFIHEPWKMPEGIQRGAGCIIGKDYPGPIVDHAVARQLALNAYKK